LAYKIGNVIVKYREYSKFNTTQITTTIHSEYLSSYKQLMQSIDRPMNLGLTCLLELLLNDQELMDKFIETVKYKY
jgi:hypothetical protein